MEQWKQLADIKWTVFGKVVKLWPVLAVEQVVVALLVWDTFFRG